MCKTALHPLLRQLPKCEHHVHIEGTLMPSLLFSLAARNSVTLPQNDSAYASDAKLLERYSKFTSLDDFLRYYFTGMSVLIQQQDFEDLAWAYFQTAHSDGLVHAEISFDPQAHLERGVSFSTVLNGLVAARKRAQAELNMSVQIINCFLRHLPPQQALQFWQSDDFQTAVVAGHITGIGLDSSENAGYPADSYGEVYEKAAAAKLRLTAHAGEEGPPENIRMALHSLGCQRIDHGIRLAEDLELMELVAQRGIMLTVCPISNLRLQCVNNISQVPIRRFLDMGVKFSLNSDDPAYFGGYVLENYCAVQEAFELSIEDWRRICLASVEGSWCSEERKTQLREMLAHTIGTFEQNS